MPKWNLSPCRTTTFAVYCALTGLAAATQVRADDAPAPLFDGATLAGWTTLDGGPVTRGWEVVDGMIHLAPSDDRVGHIVTAREIGNFVLSFEFKIAPQGNSGLKYRVRDFDGSILGCEYQIYDDAHPTHPVEPRNSTGSLYDLYEPAGDRLLHPAGEFNTAKIVVVNEVIEHWLNGRLIVRAIVGSPEWDRRIAGSKFNDDAGFGENRFGKLMLTDHGSEVWYRNFEFTELPTEIPAPVPSLASTGQCGLIATVPGTAWNGPATACAPRRCDRRCVRARRCCR
ncbi:MAG: DUF1080 domain-containing protein [Planctomycetaceae bacterium]